MLESARCTSAQAGILGFGNFGADVSGSGFILATLGVWGLGSRVRESAKQS